MNNWIATFQCKQVDANDIDLDSIDIFDIAHSLATTNRFVGHLRVPYSVAQHSIWVADKVGYIGGTVQEQAVALLHDASEAYLGDIAAPYKPLLPDYINLENKFQDAILRAFGLCSNRGTYEIVAWCDKLAGLVEAVSLHPYPFQEIDWVQSWLTVVSTEKRVEPTDWWRVEREFISRAREFGIKHI